MLLKELCAQGKSVVVNSHLLHELELICDRVAIMQEGKLLTVKKIEELTIQSQAVQIEVASISDEEFQDVQQKFKEFHVELEHESKFDKLMLQSDSQSVLDSLIDLLRKKNISIIQLQRSKMTLEEAFLHLLKKKE